MDKYNVFFEKYNQASNKELKDKLLKEFMFNLSPDELMAWLREGNAFIKENLSLLINSGDTSNIQFAKDCLDDLEAFLRPTSVRKAA